MLYDEKLHITIRMQIVGHCRYSYIEMHNLLIDWNMLIKYTTIIFLFYVHKYPMKNQQNQIIVLFKLQNYFNNILYENTISHIHRI